MNHELVYKTSIESYNNKNPMLGNYKHYLLVNEYYYNITIIQL